MEAEDKNRVAIDSADVDAIRGIFDPSCVTKRDKYVSDRQELDLAAVLRDPSRIDALTDAEADAYYAEGNRVFCGGNYDYMMVNSPYDAKGEQYHGVIDPTKRKWTSKAGLKQMSEDFAVLTAAANGEGELDAHLNVGLGKPIGWSAEQYSKATVAEKAERISQFGDVSFGREVKTKFANWMGSWDLYSLGKNIDKKAGDAGTETPQYETLRWDWSETGGMEDAVKADAVERALGIAFDNGEGGTVALKDEQELAEYVYNKSDRHTLVMKNGDVFSSMLIGTDKETGKRRYRLELARGGKSEADALLVAFYENRLENQRNAMNGIAMRQIFNENADVLRYYLKYDASRSANVGGMFSRRGDVDAILTEFAEECRPYMKPDAELTAEEIAKRDHYTLTFQQLCNVLALDDKREGFRVYGNNTLSSIAAGVGNIGLEWWGEASGLVADAYHNVKAAYTYAGGDTPAERYFNQFMSWAEADIRGVTKAEVFDQDSTFGLFGGEAAKLAAFSSVMKVGRVGTLVGAAGKAASAVGRAGKVKALVALGKKMQKGAKVFGGAKPVGGNAVGFREVEVKAGKKPPKGAVLLDGKYYVRQDIKGGRGNFFAEHNRKMEELDRKLAKAKAEREAQIADFRKKRGMATDEYTQQVYGDIIDQYVGELDKINADIARNLGSGYARISEWALDVANELPAVATVALAMADSHKAQGAYKIGEGFEVQRDAEGKAVGARFDADAFEVVKKYAVYDAAGNSVFVLHIPKGLNMLAEGRAGSAAAQNAARRMLGSIDDLVKEGRFDDAARVVAVLNNAVRKNGALAAVGRWAGAKAKGAAHLAGTGVAMSETAAVVENAENRQLADGGEGAVFTPRDFALSEEQAIGALKSGVMMAAGGVTLGEAGYAAKAVRAGKMPYLEAFGRLKATKRADAMSRDAWMLAAGMAYRGWKMPLRAEDLSADPLTASMQIRREAKKAAGEYERVSGDTFGYISRAIDSLARKMTGKGGETLADIRQEAAKTYGEEYARIFDGIVEHVREARAAQFGMSYAVEKSVDYRRIGEDVEFGDFSPKDVAEGVGKLLGVKGEAVKANPVDGSFSISFKTPKGSSEITFRKADVERDLVTVDADGNTRFAGGWAQDVMDGLERKDLQNFTEEAYGDLMQKVDALGEDARRQLREGVDVDGILSAAKERGAYSTGRFFVELGGRKVVEMTDRNGVLHVSDFAHETAHGIIEAMREDGSLTGENEALLKERFGDGWEEGFVRELVERGISNVEGGFFTEGIKALQGDSSVASMLSKVKNVASRLLRRKASKDAKSGIEVMIDAKVDEAKRIAEAERVEAEEDAVRDEMADRLAQTEAQTALIPSRLPIPDSVFMDGVAPEMRKVRERELNDSGFYYDSHLGVWVNEHSAPRLYQRALYSVVSRKVGAGVALSGRVGALFGDFVKAKKAGEGEDALRKKMATVLSALDMAMPNRFEQKKIGIVLNREGTDVGVAVGKDCFVAEGEGVYASENLPPGFSIAPYSEDAYMKWFVRGSKKVTAAHNTTSTGLLKMLRDGGMSGLSVAIAPTEKGHTRFGAISVLMRSESVDPKSKYPKTPGGRKQANYLYKMNVGTPDVHVFENMRIDGDMLEKAVQASNEYEQFIAKGIDPSFGVLNEYAWLRGVKYLRATNLGMIRGESERAEFSTARQPHKFDMFAPDEVVEREGLGSAMDYWEAKLARLFKTDEIAAVVLPRFTSEQISRFATRTSIDYELIRELAKEKGISEREAEAKVRVLEKINSPLIKKFKREIRDVAFFNELDEISEMCASKGIHVEYYDVQNENTIADNIATHGLAEGTLSRNEARAEAFIRASDAVKGIAFNVIGAKGAERFFGNDYASIRERMLKVVSEAISKADEGTRPGLMSGKNANVNAAIASSIDGRTIGPFAIHVGGVDGDKGIRLEYESGKIRIPQDFIGRVNHGEKFQIAAFLNKKDKVFEKAYPEIADSFVVFSGSVDAKSGEKVKEPAWRDDNTFILNNSDGQIVIRKDRWNPRLAPEQFAQSLIGLVQSVEGWEERIRTSDAKVSEALVPSRKKRVASDLALWLADERLIQANGVGRLVETAIRKRIGDKKVDDELLKRVAEVVWKEIDDSVKQFAGEAEARFLASRFNLSGEDLLDYSKAEEYLRDTLATIESPNLTSAQQTKKVLEYWNDIIMKAVDAAVFNKHRNERSIRKEFGEAVAEEFFSAIVNNILRGTRTVRTNAEAEASGTPVGEKSLAATVSDTATAAWDRDSSGSGLTLATSGMSVVNAVDAGLARAVDLKWAKERAAAVDEIVKLVADVKAKLAKEPSAAQAIQSELMKKADAVVAKHSSSTDPIVRRSLLNEAISEASEKSRWRVVGRRRTPEQLITEAAAARIVRNLFHGEHKADEWSSALRTWVEGRVKAIGVPQSRRDEVVNRIVERATTIAYTLKGRVKADDSDVKVMREVEDATARRMLTDRILHGAMFGQAVGRHGADAEHRAVSEAKRLQAKQVEDARGLGASEVCSLLGTDIVADIENLAKVYGNGDGLAKSLISKFSEKAIREDGRFEGMTLDEFEASPVARAELARTVSGWLREVGKRLGYGQVREWAVKEAARLQSENPTFAAVHMAIARYADMLSESLNRQSTSRLLDEIDKQIDEYADGNKALSVSIPDYERKVAPRLQEYWRYAKKAMRMTDEQVQSEVSKYNNVLKLTDAELLELKGKAAGEVGDEATVARDNAIMRLNALTRFGGLKNRTFAEAMDIYGSSIAKDLAGAVQEHLVRRNARLADDARVRQAFIGELTSIRRSVKGNDFNAEENGSKGGSFLAFSVADLFRRMSIYLHEGSAAWNFVDSFRQDMSLGHITQVNFTSRWEAEMRKACQGIYGQNFERCVPDLMLKNPDYDRFSRTGWYIPEGGAKVKFNGKNVVKALPPDGTMPTNLPNHLSKANLIYIYAASQQADMQVNNFIWGRDAKYLQEVRDIIGPQGVAMAQWLTAAYARIRKELSPVSERICGMPVLSPDERYCPLSFEGDEVSVDERRFSSNPFPGFLTRRVTHDSLRLKETTDAFRMFEGRIQDSGHYLGFAEIIDRMNTTLKHPKVQTAYAQLYGQKAKNDIYAQLADALNGGRRNADTLMTGVRNFITATSLFGNVGSALKQVEGVGGWAVEMGLGGWLKGIVRNPMTSAEVREGLREIIDAGLFRTREYEGISEAMVTLMNSCEGVPEGVMSKTYNWYKRHGMDITKWVDKFASMTMAGQYYTGRRNWYIEQGLKVEDAKRRALADTDYAIQTTQQSGRAEFLHSAQRAGTAGKMLTQFSGPAFVRWGIECETLHRAAVMGDKGAWGKLASRLIALHVICPALLTLAGNLSSIMFRREDEKMKDLVAKTQKDIIASCLSGPLGGWFIYGQILNAAAYEAVMPSVRASRATSHFEAPVLSKLNSLRQMTQKTFKDVVEAAPWDYFSRREQRLIAEDAWRLIQMLFPATRVKEGVRNALELTK